MSVLPAFIVLTQLAGPVTAPSATGSDRQFESLARRYVDEFPALSPVYATELGDHRYDSQLDEVSEAERRRERAFCNGNLEQLQQINVAELSRANQIDYALLEQHLHGELWRLDALQEWAWNPLSYTSLSGGSIYGLMAREFAPLEKRLICVTDRLEQFPRLFRQIRSALAPERVPKIHAETAVKQNRGVLSILDNMVKPHLSELHEAERTRLQRAMGIAREAVEKHQQWLEKELLPNAAGDFRIGAERYDEKLPFTLKTRLTRQQIRQRAENELRRVRDEMYDLSRRVYQERHSYTDFPESPSPAYKQAIIRAALEIAYEETPEPDAIVEMAKRSLTLAADFVREKDLLTLPPDPIEIIVMPEFQRGVALAYCDSPGPLDIGQKTFYAVAPPPENWTEKQLQSFLREYNVRSIHDLTIHEAMPGHFVQLAHANRYPGRLRAVLSSGVFIEGWAVYAEQMMADQGFLDGDPLMTLIARKWYLRGIANAMIDQAIHTEGMTRDEAMRIMMEDTFQEEREAAAKWVRAQLTSTQLATYFVGYLEHVDLRRDVKRSAGDHFDLKTYHDKLLSFGSPPVQYVRAMMLDQEIPSLK
ncbi:MAG: DUF885 domain-containing protein [Pirellulaceae bacterium]